MKHGIATIERNGKPLRYHIVNKATMWRCETLFSKEPDTIAWLDSMQHGESLVDVGANVGMYTVYAGARGVNVFAFEPEAENYALLCRNIRENGISAVAYCAALSDKRELSALYLSMDGAAGSCHTLGESLDHNLTPRKCGPVQGTISMRLDDVGIKADYVKIDVDGFEHLVVDGGETTIRNCKSVLIEINTGLTVHCELIDRMVGYGFKFDTEQVKRAQRTEGAFAGCGNYIFTR